MAEAWEPVMTHSDLLKNRNVARKKNIRRWTRIRGWECRFYDYELSYGKSTEGENVPECCVFD